MLPKGYNLYPNESCMSMILNNNKVTSYSLSQVLAQNIEILGKVEIVRFLHALFNLN